MRCTDLAPRNALIMLLQEIYRTLTQMARAKSISYHTLKGRAFPIFYKGLKINKVDVQK